MFSQLKKTDWKIKEKKRKRRKKEDNKNAFFFLLTRFGNYSTDYFLFILYFTNLSEGKKVQLYLNNNNNNNKIYLFTLYKY